MSSKKSFGKSSQGTTTKGHVRPEAFDTLCVHAGVTPEPVTGAIMTPIFQTSTYVQESPGKHTGYEYARTQNPTRGALEDAIATLEKADYGVAFSSGCSASAATIHLLSAGDHVVAGDDLYGGSRRLFSKIFARHGIEFSFVDLRDPKAAANAIQKNTKLIWIESPTNPTLKLADIGAIADFARKKKVLLAVDNTFMSPYFQNPLELGADLVMHSVTKYLNGHSDVVMGFVATKRKDLFEQLKFIQNSVGAVPSPHDCFLVLRGLKTLAVRMRQTETNALNVASFLEKHKKVAKVIYPGLKSHPQHTLAKKQMRGFGGMMTFYVKGDIKSARTLLENVHIFALAESLGGVESLIEHPAIMTHASVPAEQRKELGIDDTMIRLSVGIEDVNDLIHDLDTALSRV